MSDTQLPRAESTTTTNVQARIAEFDRWYHQIDVGAGVITPGTHDSPLGLSYLDKLGLPLDCRGLRVLDNGCSDGFFSFVLEKRGAQVTAIDRLRTDQTGFAIAASLLKSQVTYFTENIYDISPDVHGQFDIVLLLGVIYHLRNPLLALDRAWELLRPGGKLFIETQVIDHHFIAPDKLPVNLADISPFIAESSVAQFFPAGATNALLIDETNTWIPNMRALRQMLEKAEFAIEAEATYGMRGYMRANKIIDPYIARLKTIDYGCGVVY